MANVKRKRLEKIDKEDTETKSSAAYCVTCGKAYTRKKGFFSVSHAPMWRGAGYLPVCNECVDKRFAFYTERLGGERLAMRRMCMKLDLYWADSIFDIVERTAGGNSKVRCYLSKLNMYRYLDKCFDDTLEEEAAKLGEAATGLDAATEFSIESAVKKQDNKRSAEIEIDDDIRAFWGPGYTDFQYSELEARRKYWMSKYPQGTVLDVGEESLLRQICSLEIDINHARAAGNSVDKNINTLNSLIGSMNLRPAQRKADESDAELEKMPLGVGIQKWEYSRPLPETPKKNRDVRETIKNITTWYLGHACKMVGLRNSYCKMYEDAMEELRVKHPEYDDEDDDSMLSGLFSKAEHSQNGTVT